MAMDTTNQTLGWRSRSRTPRANNAEASTDKPGQLLPHARPTGESATWLAHMLLATLGQHRHRGGTLMAPALAQTSQPPSLQPFSMQPSQPPAAWDFPRQLEECAVCAASQASPWNQLESAQPSRVRLCTESHGAAQSRALQQALARFPLPIVVFSEISAFPDDNFWLVLNT